MQEEIWRDGGVILRQSKRKGSHDNGFGLHGHLKAVDEIDRHAEEGEFGNDIKSADELPSSKLNRGFL